MNATLIETVIGWKLEDARSWLQKHNGDVALQIIETAPPVRPPRRNPQKSKPDDTQREAQNHVLSKSRERAGDWRVLRCRYLDSSAARAGASTCGGEIGVVIEIVTAREILKNEDEPSAA